jgi:hypothetical protein
MPSNTYRPIVRYPAPLRMQIAQADNLARALGALSGKASDRELGFLWLLGRADEVRTLVDEVVREWSEGTIDTAYACEAIGSYVGAVHVALHRRYGGYGASCCGPHLEPFDGPSVRSVTPRGVRAPLESGVQTLSPAHLDEENAPHVASVAPRKSTG